MVHSVETVHYCQNVFGCELVKLSYFSILLLCFTCYRYTVNKDEYITDRDGSKQSLWNVRDDDSNEEDDSVEPVISEDESNEEERDTEEHGDTCDEVNEVCDLASYRRLTVTKT